MGPFRADDLSCAVPARRFLRSESRVGRLCDGGARAGASTRVARRAGVVRPLVRHWPRWPALRSLMESAFGGFEPLRIEETVESRAAGRTGRAAGNRSGQGRGDLGAGSHPAHSGGAPTGDERGGERSLPQRVSLRQLARRIPLPEGVAEEQVTASYKDGILEVRVPVPTQKPAAKKIQVQRT